MTSLSAKSRAILNRAGWTFVYVFATLEVAAPTASILDVNTLKASGLAAIAAALSAVKNAVRTPPEAKA